MKSTNTKIVWFLSRGYKAKQIGEVLNLSPRTVEKKIEILKAAYDVKNVTHLVAYYLRQGIIK